MTKREFIMLDDLYCEALTIAGCEGYEEARDEFKNILDDETIEKLAKSDFGQITFMRDLEGSRNTNYERATLAYALALAMVMRERLDEIL